MRKVSQGFAQWQRSVFLPPGTALERGQMLPVQPCGDVGKAYALNLAQ